MLRTAVRRLAEGAAASLVLSLVTVFLLTGCPDFSDIDLPWENTNAANSNANANANLNGNTNSSANANLNGSTNTNTNSSSSNDNATNDNSTTGGGTVIGNGTGNPVNSNGSGQNNANNNGSGTNFPTAIERTRIVGTGDAVPGQPATVRFTEFGDPVIDSTGRVAFWALYSGSGALGFGGLYVWENGTVRRVLDDNPSITGVVPGRTTADYFGRFQKTSSFDPLAQPLIWAGGNRLLFVSTVAWQKPSLGFYRWRATDENFARIADLEQIVALFPNAAAGAFVPDFATPGVSDNGIGYFGVDYRYFTQPPGATLVTGQGVFRSDGTNVSIVADVVDSSTTPGDVPSQGPDAYFDRITSLTTLNAAGDMLMEARYSDGDGNWGLYLNRNNDLFRVIDNRPGVTWPGLVPNVRVNAAAKKIVFANGPLGHIAIDAVLTEGSATREVVLMYDFAAQTWFELTGPDGAPAVALLSGVNDDAQALILSNGNPFVIGGGQRTQVNSFVPPEINGVQVTWPENGGAINNNGRAIVRYNRGGGIGLAFWTGQQLFAVADALANLPPGAASVSTISDPRRDRVGRSGLLNDLDQFVFRITLTGGGQEIYRGAGL